MSFQEHQGLCLAIVVLIVVVLLVYYYRNNQRRSQRYEYDGGYGYESRRGYDSGRGRRGYDSGRGRRGYEGGRGRRGGYGNSVTTCLGNMNRPCPPGYALYDSAGVLYCVPADRVPEPIKCTAWSPNASAEAEALGEMGSIQTFEFSGERALDRALDHGISNGRLESELGLSEFDKLHGAGYIDPQLQNPAEWSV